MDDIVDPGTDKVIFPGGQIPLVQKHKGVFFL
jgi:hypothetical protein